MKITILCVGKIKEDFYRKAIAEYSKRLSRYCKLEILEVADEKTPEQASETEQEHIKRKEGERIIKNIKDGMYIYVLAIQGKQRDSVKFAKEIEQLGITGKSHICFIIGGSLGLSQEVMNKADSFLSFSEMTFPHQLMRVVLLEQIYRGYRIIQNEPYHK